jgi:hypothetical protein
MTKEPDSSIKQLINSLDENNGFLRLKFPFKLENLNTTQADFLNLSKKIGTPVSQDVKGQLILSVKNEALSPNDSKTRGPNTNKKLSFHTDRCDVIAFLCIQPAKTGGENQIVNSYQIESTIKNERPDLHKTLCQKFPYKTHTIDQANPLPYCEQPIFSWCDSFFACSYLRVLIERANNDPQCPDLSTLQKEALDFLDLVCEREELQTRFTLQRGDMLFLNNWTTLHRRTAFEDFNEPDQRRHLLRVWLSMPNSRPIDQSFLANFGSVEAGAIRGGITPQS